MPLALPAEIGGHLARDLPNLLREMRYTACRVSALIRRAAELWPEGKPAHGTRLDTTAGVLHRSFLSAEYMRHAYHGGYTALR